MCRTDLFDVLFSDIYLKLLLQVDVNWPVMNVLDVVMHVHVSVIQRITPNIYVRGVCHRLSENCVVRFVISVSRADLCICLLIVVNNVGGVWY